MADMGHTGSQAGRKIAGLFRLIKSSVDYAAGIPDKENYGDPLGKLQPGDIAEYTLQHHSTVRNPKVPHYDLRLSGPEGLYSWAVPKAELPETGETKPVFQTQVHRPSYADFQGEIGKGYGAGSVRMADRGKAVIGKVTPHSVHFTLAHTKVPTNYTLVQTKGTKWLLRAMPTGKVPGVGDKPTYHRIDAVDLDDAIGKATEVQAKIDGASGIIDINRKGDIGVYSVNPRVTGEPVQHTERMGLEGTSGLPDTTVRGELYYTDRSGKAIPFKDVSGLLNQKLIKSIETRRSKRLRPRIAVFDVIRYKGKTVGDMTDAERHAFIDDFMAGLSGPARRVMHEPDTATTEKAKRKLVEGIRKGLNPTTQEGVVLRMPDGRVLKFKNREDATVYMAGTYPGEGRRQDTAGGLTYSNEPGGEPVGRVGTGFTDEELADVVRNLKQYMGKPMRIQHMGQFSSGKHRAPSFAGWETDKPVKTAQVAGWMFDQKPSRLSLSGVVPELQDRTNVTRPGDSMETPETVTRDQAMHQLYSRYGKPMIAQAITGAGFPRIGRFVNEWNPTVDIRTGISKGTGQRSGTSAMFKVEHQFPTPRGSQFPTHTPTDQEVQESIALSQGPVTQPVKQVASQVPPPPPPKVEPPTVKQSAAAEPQHAVSRIRKMLRALPPNPSPAADNSEVPEKTAGRQIPPHVQAARVAGNTEVLRRMQRASTESRLRNEAARQTARELHAEYMKRHHPTRLQEFHRNLSDAGTLANHESGTKAGSIGVDLDGTLAKYRGWKGIEHIGKPIPKMVERVKRMLRDGKEVKIFTARAGSGKKAVKVVKEWCKQHIGCVLPVTNVKDPGMSRIYDDRAVQIEKNTGEKVACNVDKDALKKAARKIVHCGDYGILYLQPSTGTVHWTMGDADGSEKEHTTSEEIKKLLGDVKGVKEVVIGDEWSPRGDDWVKVATTAEQVEIAASKTDTAPTDAQKETGNYRKGRITIHGLQIAIENPEGSYRSGTSADGTKWKNLMHAHYGYFTKVDSEGKLTGKDGDSVDCFIGPDPSSFMVYVIDQVNPGTGTFDEHKCILGCRSADEAEKLYLSCYDKGWKGLGAVTPMLMWRFKRWLKDGDLKKPAAKFEKKAQEAGLEKLLMLADDIPRVLINWWHRRNGGTEQETPESHNAFVVSKPVIKPNVAVPKVPDLSKSAQTLPLALGAAALGTALADRQQSHASQRYLEAREKAPKVTLLNRPHVPHGVKLLRSPRQGERFIRRYPETKALAKEIRQHLAASSPGGMYVSGGKESPPAITHPRHESVQVLKHEIGHALADADAHKHHHGYSGHPILSTALAPIIGSTNTPLYEIERDAWNRSQVPDSDDVRSSALGTYQAGLNRSAYTVRGALAGGTAGHMWKNRENLVHRLGKLLKSASAMQVLNTPLKDLRPLTRTGRWLRKPLGPKARSMLGNTVTDQVDAKSRILGRKLVTQPDTLAVGAAGSLTPIPGSGVAAAIGYKKLKDAIKAALRQPKPPQQLPRGFSIKQSSLPVVRMDFCRDGNVKASADIEIADTAEARRTGLMYRDSVPDNHGMFFSKAGSFWMKNVEVPLDIVFLNDQGRILEKQSMVPQDSPPYRHYEPKTAGAEHAIELAAGWFDRMGIKVGDTVIAVAPGT